ncbi:MAG: hypothetical protein MjAS7_2418 [Metallosphaera javensis (ex Sakai et al. 2022)]|nr:MAG: hypothetical protein MjAS7_2418 [Metallosphaera javensis (ex Sakai et al. 2022)]
MIIQAIPEMRFPKINMVSALTLKRAVMNSETEVSTVEAELIIPRYSFTTPDEAAVNVMKG